MRQEVTIKKSRDTKCCGIQGLNKLKGEKYFFISNNFTVALKILIYSYWHCSN